MHNNKLTVKTVNFTAALFVRSSVPKRCKGNDIDPPPSSEDLWLSIPWGFQRHFHCCSTYISEPFQYWHIFLQLSAFANFHSTLFLLGRTLLLHLGSRMQCQPIRKPVQLLLYFLQLLQYINSNIFYHNFSFPAKIHGIRRDFPFLFVLVNNMCVLFVNTRSK